MAWLIQTWQAPITPPLERREGGANGMMQNEKRVCREGGGEGKVLKCA